MSFIVLYQPASLAAPGVGRFDSLAAPADLLCLVLVAGAKRDAESQAVRKNLEWVKGKL